MADFTTHYDWPRTRTYDADTTMVISSRGPGKTYGLRYTFVSDYLKRGIRFAEVTRRANELTDLSFGYFDKMTANDEFPNHVFKSTSTKAFIAERPAEGEKPEWQLIGYFVSLSQMQLCKKRTFVNVRNILMDEAVLDARDRNHDYLTNEWGLLTQMVDSLTREHAGDADKLGKPHVYLLGNKCDLLNPYFAVCGLTDEPPYGYTWHRNKTFLIHNVEPGEYEDRKMAETVTGRMAAGTDEEQVLRGEGFTGNNPDFVHRRPRTAKYQFGIVFHGDRFGIWYDERQAYFYVDSKIPNNAASVYALTTEDNRINYIMAKSSEKFLRSFCEFYGMGMIRFSTVVIRNKFNRVMRLFGYR
jgi:hypothetical protein